MGESGVCKGAQFMAIAGLSKGNSIGDPELFEECQDFINNSVEVEEKTDEKC